MRLICDKTYPPAHFPLLRIRKGVKIVSCVVVQLFTLNNNVFFLFPALCEAPCKGAFTKGGPIGEKKSIFQGKSI